jgi:acetylornithine deacetylase/succinyl-diaminopimelate desuccinylase-like protein
VFSTNGVATAGMHAIPTVGFGPGHEKWAHAPNERVEVEHLVRAATFYMSFATEFVRR